MSNHGQVSYGDDLGKAFELAEEVENLCHQYSEAKKLGNPNILSKKEMNEYLKKIKDYKNYYLLIWSEDNIMKTWQLQVLI